MRFQKNLKGMKLRLFYDTLIKARVRDADRVEGKALNCKMSKEVLQISLRLEESLFQTFFSELNS